MSRKSLKKAYKRLNATEYTNVIKDTLIPIFDDYDGEFIAVINHNTKFTIKKHYFNNIFMGYNIYANEALLETKSTKKKAQKYLGKLLHEIGR